MKQFAKRVITAVVCNRVVWFVIQLTLRPLSVVYRRLAWLRGWALADSDAFSQKCRKVFAERVVRHGPFQGMKYPSFKSYGSQLYPKLLGSYEKEIAPVLEAIRGRRYSAVVNIGCGEGYYAVGLARMFPGATVYAYDTNANAVGQCRQMAALNGVEVVTGGFCDQAVMSGLDLGERALIVSDCEGYENRLFDATLADRLRRHDFLIELHDFIAIESTRNMTAAFAATHDCVVIESVDDIVKAYTYEFPELAGFSLGERRRLLAEGRPAIMRWLFATARAGEAARQA